MTENPQQPPNALELFPDAERIVDAFGGVRPMAARLGIAATTIQGWKSRGNIPDARRTEVHDAALAAGIDLAAMEPLDAAAPAMPGGDQPAPDNVTPEEPAPGNAAVAAAPAARSASSIAWLALAIAAVAGIAVATQPIWLPAQSGDASDNPAAAKLAALEAAVDLGPLAARIDALESALKSQREAAMRQAAALQAALRKAASQPAAPDLAPRLDALAAQRNQDREGLVSVSERLEALARAMQLAGANQSETRALELGSIRAELAELAARIDDASARRVSVDSETATLVLAVATLEDAVSSGAPFNTPLAIIERIAGNDPALSGFIAVLASHAGGGIPTQARLTRDFDAISARVGAPLWTNTGLSWIDKILLQIDSLVTIRRLEDAEGKAMPVVGVERALADGDLPSAIAALEGVDGVGAAWALRAKSRIAADRAMAGLRLRAIEMLDAGQPAETAQ